jgi:hypothetical protein
MLDRSEKLGCLLMVVSHVAQGVGGYVLIRGIVATEGTSDYAGPVFGFLLALCPVYFITSVSIFIADVFFMSVKNHRGELYRPILLRNDWVLWIFAVEALAVYPFNAVVNKRQARHCYPKGNGRQVGRNLK